MEFKTKIQKKIVTIRANEHSIDSGGTCLRGYLHCSYKDLTDKFGKPENGDGEKVRAEWVIEAKIDGKKVVATIYDWKQYTALSKLTEWNIGGFDRNAVELIQSLFPGKTVFHS
jgi:hypothetical protein